MLEVDACSSPRAGQTRQTTFGCVSSILTGGLLLLLLGMVLAMVVMVVQEAEKRSAHFSLLRMVDRVKMSDWGKKRELGFFRPCSLCLFSLALTVLGVFWPGERGSNMGAERGRRWREEERGEGCE